MCLHHHLSSLAKGPLSLLVQLVCAGRFDRPASQASIKFGECFNKSLVLSSEMFGWLTTGLSKRRSLGGLFTATAVIGLYCLRWKVARL